MSGVVCPHCSEEFPIFGPSRGKETAEKFRIPFLGSLPLDRTFSELCDLGKVEDYNSNLFLNTIPEMLTK